jgi:hypothetical protein
LLSNKNARGQDGCSVFGRLCLTGFRIVATRKTRVSVRVALTRSIPCKGSQLLSALQALCEELSCDYLALVRAINADCTEIMSSEYPDSSSLPDRLYSVLAQCAAIQVVNLLIAEAVEIWFLFCLQRCVLAKQRRA